MLTIAYYSIFQRTVVSIFNILVNLQTIIVSWSWLQGIKMWLIIHDSFFLSIFISIQRIYQRKCFVKCVILPLVWFGSLTPETFDLNKLDCFEHVACYHNYEFHSPAFVLKMKNLNIFCLFLCILDPWSLFEISFRSLKS